MNDEFQMTKASEARERTPAVIRNLKFEIRNLQNARR